MDGNRVPSFRSAIAVLICAGLFAVPAFGARKHHTSSSKTHRAHRASYAHRRSHRLRGQQAIDPERVTQIQQALIREHYLTGAPSGDWDATTIAAMKKFQGDQGWQTKLMPDSRALKKLGLGPDYSNALNAKNSSFAPPPSDDSIPTPQDAGFTTASGVSQ
jgi:Putative peptidoglycan binding domain